MIYSFNGKAVYDLSARDREWTGLNVFLGVQNVTNRRDFASHSWNRRTNSQQLGEQPGIFPILGFDWRF